VKSNKVTKKADYIGERAMPFEVLPPTPCNAGYRVRLDEYDSSEMTSTIADDVTVDDDNGDAIGVDVAHITRKRRPSRKKSMLGQEHAEHLYGGSFLRNTGRFGSGAYKSNAYWMGDPDPCDEEHVNVIHCFGGA